MASLEKNYCDYKICLYGEYGAGKTTIFRKAAKIWKAESSGKNVADFRCWVDFPNIGRKRIGFYDTAGVELYDSSMTMYYRGAQCIILVYDISSDSSLDYICKHYNEYIKSKYTSHIIILRNKTDLEGSGEVEVTKENELQKFTVSEIGKDLGNAIRKKYGDKEVLSIYDVSGVTGTGLETFLNTDLLNILEGTVPTKYRGDTFKPSYVESGEEIEKRKGCCG